VQHHLIHLICGSTGAGKTTYALRLSDHLEGVRFSIDEWMATLFWMDTPQPLNPAWSIERVERCLTQIWAVALEVGGADLALRARGHEHWRAAWRY
jgi:predicted kinase